MNYQKITLLSLIVFSYFPILFFQDYNNVDSYSFWGRFIGLTGVVTLMWMFLLGIRGLVSRLIPDLFWINSIHKKLGMYAITILLTHPVFMFLYYNSFETNLLTPAIETEFDKYVFFGKIAFSFLAVNWLASVFLRKKLSFRWWKKLHFISYIVLPLGIFHGMNIGFNLRTITILEYYFYFIALVYSLAVLYRILFRLGIFRLKYKVVNLTKVTKDVVKIDLMPLGSKLLPKHGQFIYFQRNLKTETHPFTVSHFDEATGQISITPKALGPYTKELQTILKDEVVFLDGPYGVFTEESAEEKPIIIIAGGIGITPFMWMVDKLAQGWNRNVTLFYGNKTQDDIAYSPQIEEVHRNNPNFKLVNVLSEQENYSGEKGFITVDVIKKYISDDLNNYNFFVSGPPVLITKISKELRDSGVNKQSLHTEMFSL